MRSNKIPNTTKQTAKSFRDFFSMNGEAILLEEKDIGIFNGMLTANVPYSQVLAW